ncbi:DNA topoisomerase I [archaeon CG06_land_8_20_14_3_00_37_11]|nr:MAG: DNA topoisomerase I [archaeon CG06_land_8_20_14_3_00_37_11]
MTHTLMISEKPDAAHKIAMALADKNTIHEIKINKTRYYTFKRGGKNYAVVPAVGHLFTLKNLNGKKWTYPVFESEWVPSFEADKKALFTKQYYKNFEKMGKDADEFIVCTDWDTEGSVIAYNILRFILKRKTAQRMFFTTLTSEELNESFENAKKTIDKGMINAGLARHRLDWMYGVNLTRALTLSLKKARGGFHLLSTGRVQGPTLKILTDREEEIMKFKPEDYWEIRIKWNKDYDTIYEEKRIFQKEIMERIAKECSKAKEGVIKKVTIKEVKVPPPFPFNLTDLQSEAYNQFKYNPYKTQEIAQKLYTHALISYPRTSSQKLPPRINYAKILSKLKNQKFYSKNCEELLKEKNLKANQGKKDDSAHTAIYPTGETPKSLSVQEKNLYDLIARRFLSVFGKTGLKESKKIIINVNNNNFVSHGSTILDKGWMKHYGKYANNKETLLPELKEGEKVSVDKFETLKKETQPPNRYTHAGIVSEMEKRGLGTKGTRANIVKTLNDREYIREESIHVTKLGLGVTKALKEYCPRIISEDLTKRFEKLMELISKDKETKEEVIAHAQDVLTEISNEFKDNEEKIGKELNKSLEAMWEEESNVGEKAGKCPKCGGDLVIMYSKKNNQEFIGCANYPKCETSYSLPLTNYELTKKTCKCGAPIIITGKNKYETCIDRDCKTRIAGKCPECGNNLRLMFSHRGSRFIGCSNYPKCKKLYGLAGKGEIIFTEKKCNKCGAPIILLNDEELCLNNKECEGAGKKNGKTTR